jgi:hypothetical protein
MAGVSAMADADFAMLDDSCIADLECSSAGNGSLTVLLMTSASGRNKYQSTATTATAALKSIDLRIVIVLFLFQ